MTGETAQTLWPAALELARKQHETIARRQLLALGWSPSAIDWALRTGRLHHTEWRGVYVVGSPGLTKHGRLHAAVLSCGDDAALSHASAGSLWAIWKQRDRLIHLSLPAVRSGRGREGIRVHRRTTLGRRDLTRHWGIPVTTPLRTVIDLAAGCERAEAERLVNAADAANVLRADTLREGLRDYEGEPGVPLLASILDARAFVLSESELERLFLPLARRAGLPPPQSQRRVGRGRVDFYWPELGLVVELDSLRYHRTQLQQAEDRARDHVHLLDGRTHVRFTYHQAAHEPDYVVAVLTEIRLRSAPASTRAGASGA